MGLSWVSLRAHPPSTNEIAEWKHPDSSQEGGRDGGKRGDILYCGQWSPGGCWLGAGGEGKALNDILRITGRKCGFLEKLGPETGF